MNKLEDLKNRLNALSKALDRHKQLSDQITSEMEVIETELRRAASASFKAGDKCYYLV